MNPLEQFRQELSELMQRYGVRIESIPTYDCASTVAYFVERAGDWGILIDEDFAENPVQQV